MKRFNKNFWNDALVSFIFGFVGGFVISVMIICFL